jgi:hypothetical protein
LGSASARTISCSIGASCSGITSIGPSSLISSGTTVGDARGGGATAGGAVAFPLSLATFSSYGAPFLAVSLPTEPVECEELTKGDFYRWGAPE